jgi:hypothetical protein
MLIDRTPAEQIEFHVARMTEHDASMDRQMALHLELTSIAQVIADDVACGEHAWPATVDRYVYARDEYRKCLTARAASQA